MNRQFGYRQWQLEIDFGVDLVINCPLPNRPFEIPAQKTDARLAQGNHPPLNFNHFQFNSTLDFMKKGGFTGNGGPQFHNRLEQRHPIGRSARLLPTGTLPRLEGTRSPQQVNRS